MPSFVIRLRQSITTLSSYSLASTNINTADERTYGVGV